MAPRRGLWHRGARPRTPQHLRAPVAPARRARGAPDAAPPPGACAGWWAGASHGSGGPVGQRPRRQPARRAHVGRAEPSTAGERGTRGHGQPHPAPPRRGCGRGERGLPRCGHGSLGADVGRSVGSPKAPPRARSRAQQRPAADTGERGASVVGVALYRSPVRLRPGVRPRAKKVEICLDGSPNPSQSVLIVER